MGIRNYVALSIINVVLPFYMLQTHANTQRDFQTWLNLTATGNFDRESKNFGQFKYWLEGQERFGDDSSRMSQTLARLGVGYMVTENLSLWLGYAWVYTEEPFTSNPFEENRIWEQILWSKKYQTFSLTSRTRMEQRFMDNDTKAAFRLRQMIKFVRPFASAPNFSFVTSDEVFWHHNDYRGGNGQGLDQNRYFIGLGYKFSPTFTTEAGYMNQYIRRFGVPNFLNDILSINFILNF